jgi:alpha-ketoglutarate-dependent sulfate ester dioxygenase
VSTTIDRDAMTATAEELAAAVGFDVRPLAGHIGAEIFGPDIAAGLSDEEVAAIRAVLLRWKVVFFRDQHVSQAQHVAFGQRFGEVTPAHPTLPAAFDDHPEILLLDNQGFVGAGGGGASIESRWHTDVTFVPNPPMGSILRGVVVPEYGGDTQWANLVVAYETLSPQIRDLIDGLHAVHHNALPIAKGEMLAGLRKQFMSREILSVHPMVRVHPETGERALFVNPNFTSHVQELSRQEGTHLLALLYEHMANPAYTCRFRWQPDSIAFWDNRATAHLVPTDVPPGAHRSMQRITIAGDLPVGPDGSTSYALEGEGFPA